MLLRDAAECDHRRLALDTSHHVGESNLGSDGRTIFDGPAKCPKELNLGAGEQVAPGPVLNVFHDRRSHIGGR